MLFTRINKKLTNLKKSKAGIATRLCDRSWGMQKSPGSSVGGSGMFIPDSTFFPSRIPDPNCFHPGSRIRIKEFKYFIPKKWFLSSRNYDPGCSSRIPDFGPGSWLITHPGSRITGSKRQRIPDPDQQHCHNFISYRWVRYGYNNTYPARLEKIKINK